MEQGVSRSLYLDYAIGICSVWIASGFFLDAWAHGHVPVESFFTPYHAVFYTGMLAAMIIFAIFIFRNRARGLSWRQSLPPGYRLAALGIPMFFLAGVGDMCWHLFLGIEEGVDALLSPTHQLLGFSLFVIASGPIRSVLFDRANAKSFANQLPLVLGLASWLMLLHFGTAYAFDPGAGRTNVPPSIETFSPDYLTAISIGYYKIANGVLVIMLQAALVAGFALWMTSRIRLRPGAFTLLYLIAGIPAAAAFTNATPLLLVTILQALVAGIVTDILVARYDPQPERATFFRIFSIIVPMTYSGVYLLAMCGFGGIWWDWNVALGAWMWTGVIGLALGFIGTARRATP